MPDVEIILAITPKRHRNFKTLIKKIDCSAIFIETLQNLELQKPTWSDYKHHNIIKFLACVVPSSTNNNCHQKPTLVGPVTKQLYYSLVCFEVLPRHSNIMVDKGFNLFYDCTARCVHFTAPSEKRVYLFLLGDMKMYTSGTTFVEDND